MRTLFVCYSHRDDHWKEALLLHIGFLKDVIDVWHDGAVETGQHWRHEIRDALGRAAAAVVIISADFLRSRFIREAELPVLLKKRESEGLRLFPVYARPCHWRREEWLNDTQMHPDDGKALSLRPKPQVENLLAEFSRELECALASQAGPRRDPVVARYEDALRAYDERLEVHWQSFRRERQARRQAWADRAEADWKAEHSEDRVRQSFEALDRQEEAFEVVLLRQLQQLKSGNAGGQSLGADRSVVDAGPP